MTSSTPFEKLSPARQKAIDRFLEELQHRNCEEIKNPDQKTGVEYEFRKDISTIADVSVDTVTRTLSRDKDAIQARLNERDDLNYHGDNACHPEYVFKGVTREPDDNDGDAVDENGELEWEPVGEEETEVSDQQKKLEEEFKQTGSSGNKTGTGRHETRRHTTDDAPSFEQARRDLDRPGSTPTPTPNMRKVTALLVVGAVALAIAIGRIVRSNDEDE